MPIRADAAVLRLPLSIPLCLLGTCFAAAGAAHAGTTGSLALTSDYLFRGLSQTNQEPALQGGIEYAADSGLYIGAWGSNVSWLSDQDSDATPISNSLELDVYGGYRGSFGENAGYDLGAIYYVYPGDYPDGFNRPHTGELYAGLTAGVFAAKYFYSVTDLFGVADSDGSGYLDLAVNWEFTPGWTLNLHGGRQWIENNVNDYSDWKLGVSKNFGSGFSIAVAYVDTNADEALNTNAFGNFLGDSTFVLTLGKAF